jgi:N-methylhydantoinase A
LRDFHLLAFGGAGPIHAAQMALELGMRGVLVPAFPGVTSALGLLLSDVRYDYVTSELSRIDTTAPEHVRTVLETLRAQGERALLDQGFAPDQLRYEFALDLRYVGQGYDLTVLLAAPPADAAALHATREQFDRDHEHLTGHAAADEHVEIVNYRVTAIAVVPQASIGSPFAAAGSLAGAKLGERLTWLGPDEAIATALYDRAKLPPGAEIDGPAILLQNDATTVIGIGQRARVVELGQIEIVNLNARATAADRDAEFAVH